MKTIKTSKEHFDKYDNLWRVKGCPFLPTPVSKEEILKALENGDNHLNSIRLSAWDGIAHYVGWTSDSGGKKYKSQAEQVCMLKHYAIYHVAKYTPEFE